MIVQAVGGIRVVVTLKDYRLDLEAMARAITPMTKMVFIANPNNPTATIVTADEVAHFMARVPDRADRGVRRGLHRVRPGAGLPGRARLRCKQGRKVMVLRTFSKAASLAGLRVGYGGRRRGLHRADEPHPPALQRELAGPGRRAGRARRRVPHARVRAHDRGRPALPLRRVQRAGHQVRAVARQLHPGRRRPQRLGCLSAAAQGRRDRPAA